ncbi:unnamed protein product [Lactuca virosa]|uniref:Uncharacterized protein n=1 Tax=Lactuca virosa TaxID=75947 RepID=A0AAU9P299_9ASTR|nr:unnamed protein product [Lactuca virosa]
MEYFQTTFNSNTTSVNEALKSLGSLFKTEKTKLQEIRTGIKTDHESFQATISSHLSQLKDELVKDSLALKSEEAKVISTKLDALEKQAVFAMLHRLEGVSDPSFNPKQGGESVAGGSRKEGPKAPVKPIVKNEPKGTEKLFRDDPILDNEDEEEPTEEELKRRKVCEAELDEHQRIIREAE